MRNAILQKQNSDIKMKVSSEFLFINIFAVIF